MLPIIRYHLGDVFEEKISGILDNNSSRIGKYFPSIDVPILDAEMTNISGCQILLTALDSAKYIVPKAIESGAVSVVVPIGIL
jgi:hypothetical protein